MTTTKQPDQKPASESAILSAEMAWQRSRRLLPKILPIGMLGLIIISGFMIWKLPVFQTSNWAVVFEDRSFDAPTRRLALLELKSLGITLRTSVRGEIEVHPDQLSVVESALENKGLKPATLAEIKAGTESPLAILESIAQREQRQQSIKEKEIAWLIQRSGNVGQTHVTIEPISGTRRFINRGNAPKYRVRVFLEPVGDNSKLSAEAVNQIESIVLASLPETGPNQITIHDSQTIYLMAGEIRTDQQLPETALTVKLAERGQALSEQLKKQIPELGQATVLVRLYEVTEGHEVQDTARSGQVPATQKPLLYLNESVEIESPQMVSNSQGESLKTMRARVQIVHENSGPFTENSDFRKEIHARVSKLMAPVLVEQLDWLDTTRPVLAQNHSQDTREKSLAKNRQPLVEKPETHLKPLAGTQHGSVPPWVMGGALAFIAGGVFLAWTGYRSRTFDSKRTWVKNETASSWARDLANAVSSNEPHFDKKQEPRDVLQSKQAARVLGDWISAERDPDQEPTV
jgi:hypothetical protein